MRLLQISLRSMLLYALILVLFSIPVSLFSIRKFTNAEVDKSIALHADQFARHIKSYEYLDDLDLDLKIWDELSYDIVLEPSDGKLSDKLYQTVSMYDSLEQELHPFRTLSTTVIIKDKPYLLTVRLSLVETNELVAALLIVQALLIVLLVGGLVLLNRSLSKKLWKPFYSTLEQLKVYELDKNETIVAQKTNVIEFDDLNKTIIHLTARNKEVFLQQKEFIENASHELQTPISIFQSKLDNLMQGPSLSESEAETLLELEQTAQRMARLNKNLLLLSKIDNDQFTTLEEVDVAELATKLISNVKPMADLESISVTSTIAPFILRANRTLIEVLLTNLLHNAVRHSTPGGKVEVRLEGQVISIANTGNRLTMPPERMFDRFTKESKSGTSTGLGLAIVKKICDTNSYGINYTYQAGEHVFTLSL